MFGRKGLQKQVEQLTDANQKLRGELDEIKQGSAYSLAQSYLKGIEEILVSDVLNVSEAIDELFESLIQDITEAGQEVSDEVKIQVLAAAEAFMREHASELIANRMRGRETNVMASLAIQQAMDTPKSLNVPVAGETLSQLKWRADQLLDMTSSSYALPLAELRSGDCITIDFTENAQVAAQPGYDSKGNNVSYPIRRISFTTINPEFGTMIVDHDSWIEKPATRDEALKGARKVRLTSQNPDTGEGEKPYIPILVKGKRLHISRFEGGKVTDDSKLHVWRINLGDFPVMP